jgi:serine/threonine-protein kinase
LVSTAEVDSRRVEDLYAALVTLESSEADRILDRECANAPEIRAAVERLLTAHRNAPATRVAGRSADFTGPIQERPAPIIPDSARVGRYVVLRHIAAGGMGDVYVAYDESLDRKIALKLLRPSQISDWSLRREAQALARLSHPNVVQVHDIGYYDGQPFVAMELVNGVPLSEWLTGEVRTAEAILRMFVQCGRGLVAAHEAGLVHRDFKPANVVVGDDGRARVLDFGIVTGPSVDPDPASGASELLAGTPQYMSPEQLSGEAATAASDQFSFAVALYRALYGEAPFAGDGLVAMHANVRVGAVRPPPAGKAPEWVAPLLLRALSHAPSARHSSLAEMLEAIERRLPRDPELDPKTTRPARLALAFAIIVVAVGILVGAQIRGGFAKITAREFMVIPTVAFGITAGGALLFRKRLLANRYGARMTGFMLVATSTLIAHRLLALHLGESFSQILSVDMLALGFELLLGSLFLVRWFAFCAGLMFLGSLTAAFVPHLATPAMIVASLGSLTLALPMMQRD